jgi:DNA topoisomerase 2-associated protein PAT1
VFNALFHIITQHLLLLFPSTRAAAIAVTNFVPTPQHDLADQQVWQLLAAIALHASLEQQQYLVATLREKILDNVVSANRDWASNEDAAIKLANVNIFLHALGLDSSQVVV